MARHRLAGPGGGAGAARARAADRRPQRQHRVDRQAGTGHRGPPPRRRRPRARHAEPGRSGAHGRRCCSAVCAVLLGLIVGGALGLIAGYFRGRADTGADRPVRRPARRSPSSSSRSRSSRCSPAAGVSSTRRMVVLILALGVVSIPSSARITRASTLSWCRARVRTGLPSHRRPEPLDHRSARCCPTCCRRCSRSRCWASPS